jgi:hypothetical protein
MSGWRALAILATWAGASVAMADPVPVAPTYVGLWEKTPTRADVAQVFPESALNTHIKVLVPCTLGADRRPADCRPQIAVGPIGDTEKAAALLAGLWDGPMGQWASLPAGAAIWIGADFEPPIGVIGDPSFEPSVVMPSGAFAPRKWSHWTARPSLAQIAAAVPVEPAPDRYHGDADCIVGDGGKLEACALEPIKGYCMGDAGGGPCPQADPILLQLTSLIRAPATTPDGHSSQGRRIYFSLVLVPVVDRRPPPPALAPRLAH